MILSQCERAMCGLSICIKGSINHALINIYRGGGVSAVINHKSSHSTVVLVSLFLYQTENVICLFVFCEIQKIFKS